MYTAGSTLTPMSNDEISFLMRVYEKRRWFLIKCCLAFVPVMIIAAIRYEEIEPWFNVKHKQWYEKDIAYYFAKLPVYLTHISVGLAIFSVIAIYMNYARVRPLKADAQSGMKQKIPCIITRKQHMPLTNQYYVWTDNPHKPGYEVAEHIYNNCSEGDVIYLYRAPKSKLVFEKDGRYEIL